MRHLAILALLLAGCARHPSAAPGTGVAAVAFRDSVPGWQRLGTSGFSQHYLDRAYDHVTYLEQDALGPNPQDALAFALMTELASNRAVDLFLLVNSGDASGVVARVPPQLRGRLRLVYNTGAGGGAQASTWQELGARAYVAHPGTSNLAPFFYVDFLRDWVDGQPLGTAVASANASLHQRLSGFSAPVILAASGFRARREDLPYWEAATRAQLTGDDSFAVR